MSTTEIQADNNSTDTVDLLELIGILFDYKWLILTITSVFAVVGIIYALLATPIYQASAMVQVESKKSSIAGLESMSALMENESPAVTEIEIIKSRFIIGKAVDNLKLDITATPQRFPIVGNFMARRFTAAQKGDIATSPAEFLSAYDWGGASIHISLLELPAYLFDKPLTLVAGKNGSYQLLIDDTHLLEGETGKRVDNSGIQIHVDELVANPGTQFIVQKSTRLNVILDFQQKLNASERGKQTGMIGLSIENEDPAFAKSLLNELAHLYVQQNVERMSAEAANSLEFLHQQLPQVRAEMEKAENLLNNFQKSSKSVDITAETQSVLSQIVELETALSDLKIKQLEMDKKFTSSHPTYQVLLNQISNLENTKTSMESKVKGLPATQQELLRLSRDVQVSSQIYTQMLQKSQELDITRASTVGNVRIIDNADVDIRHPVAPKRALIVVIITLLGGILSVVIAFIHNLLHSGVENPAAIEALNLPVYASVPFSAMQEEAQKKHEQGSKYLPILADTYPTDPSMEAIRSLHTSLHFAMLEASNNIIMLSGPSPKVGKSFVSVNLATLMAQTGKKVLLIDADMRKGYLHKFFGLTSANNGLSSLLAKQCEQDSVIVHSNITGLDFIPRGPIPPNPSELLLNKHFAEAILQLASHYDTVIIDTPPILAVADAITVSKLAGASFIVARFGETPLGEIRATIRQFEQNGIQLKGGILNATRKKLMNYYNYQKYGYSNYQYSYQSDKE